MLYCGDALTVLAGHESESVQCCVSSPPYWGLRDYGTAKWEGGDAACSHAVGRRNHGAEKQATQHGSSRDRIGRDCKCGARRVDAQLGLERTPEEYVANMVSVFREVRRVLRKDGTLWLNCGDSYASAFACERRNVVGAGSPDAFVRRADRLSGVLKNKDLVGIPWRLAFALQADGWWLRSDIIWAKPNPMPESVTDRPTKAHEYVFLLSKSPTYYYDAAAIAEPLAEPKGSGGWQSMQRRREQFDEQYSRKTAAERNDADTLRHFHRDYDSGRNARTVWEIATQPYPSAHFATFPEELARRCILAGSSNKACEHCGAPWERVVERTPMVLDRSERTHPMGRTRSSGTMLQAPTSETVGWQPTCTCEQQGTGSCVILDPFGGSGTVAQVATGNGRRAIYIDLNPKYRELAKQRIGPMLCDEAA